MSTPKFKTQVSHRVGAVTFLDVLGWKGIWQRKDDAVEDLRNLARLIEGRECLILPGETMLGALTHYIAHADAKTFQPMKANFGLMPSLEDGKRRNRRERARAYSERSAVVLAEFLEITQE